MKLRMIHLYESGQEYLCDAYNCEAAKLLSDGWLPKYEPIISGESFGCTLLQVWEQCEKQETAAKFEAMKARRRMMNEKRRVK